MNPRHAFLGVLLLLGLIVWGFSVFRTALPPGGPGTIVSLAPNLTECVYYFARESQLIGVTEYCEADREIPRVGDVSPNLERIVRLNPEYVLAIESAATREALKVLVDQGIRVEVFPSETFDDVRQMVTRLGELWSQPARAQEFVERFDAALSAPPLPDAPEVLFVVDWGPPHYVAAGGSFVGEMLATVGAVNCMGHISSPYSVIDAEGIAQRDPDWILDSSLHSSKNAERWNVLTHLRAVRDRHVRPFPPVRPGLRIPEWLEELRRLLSSRQP